MDRSLLLLALPAILTTLVGPAPAGQAALVAEAEARLAVKVLEPCQAVRVYCRPCGDRSYQTIAVESVDCVASSTGPFYEVLLNGRAVDLASVYFRDSLDRWTNVALHLGLIVRDVPRFLGWVPAGSVAPSTDDRIASEARELARNEAALVAAYRGLLERLTGRRRILLVESQHAWRVFRDDTAEVHAALYEGDPMADLVRLTARNRATRERVRDLELLLDELGG